MTGHDKRHTDQHQTCSLSQHSIHRDYYLFFFFSHSFLFSFILSIYTVIQCGLPASIANGFYVLTDQSRAYKSSVTYQCKDGYVIVGRGSLICDPDARWNGPPPRCEPVLCPNPPLVANGFATLVSNSTMFGSWVEYGCDQGYELVGEKMIQCSMAGYWEGQPGYCIGK